jgi:hypothetical protein
MQLYFGLTRFSGGGGPYNDGGLDKRKLCFADSAGGVRYDRHHFARLTATDRKDVCSIHARLVSFRYRSGVVVGLHAHCRFI